MAYLVDLYNLPEVRRISEFANFGRELDIQAVRNGYLELVKQAPRRAESGLRYFDTRPEATNAPSKSGRREEHLAIALYRASRRGMDIRLPSGQSLVLVDYQTPLKAHRSDKGIGKIDLFGIIDGQCPAVIELKVLGKAGALADTPLRALLEGLAYCAMVEANALAITQEAFARFKCNLESQRPDLIVMAPEDYWQSYLEHRKAGPWLPVLREITVQLHDILGLRADLVALKDVQFEMGGDGQAPRLLSPCSLIRVENIEVHLGSQRASRSTLLDELS